jgi:uncharacterized protein (DUF2236 family)
MWPTLRRIGAEPAMWLGAQRALLLQLAHPEVAAAVDAHSHFRQQPHRRLWATADAMVLLVWGAESERYAARGRISTIHDRIHGTLPEETPPWHQGDAYDAHDFEAQRWVWATLVDTSELIHRRYIGPLGSQQGALFDDWRGFAMAFGIPSDLLPVDHTEFDRYWADMVRTVAVSDTARRVAQAVFTPPMRLAPTALKDLGAGLALELLPHQVRLQYDERVLPATLARTARFDAWLARNYRMLPEARRSVPSAYLAGRRLLAPLGRSLTAALDPHRRSRGERQPKVSPASPDG